MTFVMDAPEPATQLKPESLPTLSAGNRLKLTCNISRQLQVLVASGTTLSHALAAVERQTKRADWHAIVQHLRSEVDEGSPLSQAMRSSGVFDAVALSLVSAGETSGNMPLMLSRLAELKRRQLKLRTQVVGAMIYPALLMTMGVNVLLVMLLFVIPRFTGLFATLHSALPPTTRMLMAASIQLQTNWAWYLGGAAAVITGVVMAIKSRAGKEFVERYSLDLPLFGPLLRSMISARIARMLGTLLESKVPLLDSLALTREGADNSQYEALIAKCEDAVSRGQPLSSVLDSTDLISPTVQEAVRNGEQTGQIGAPLVQLAEFLDEENDMILKTVTGILEPSILIVLGVLVGGMAISIFLPMFDLVTAAQGGG